jgi:replicative DNA helicase
MQPPDEHLYDLQAEASLLGACLIDPEAIYYVTNLLTSQDFYEAAHQVTYQAMVNVAERGNVLDVVTVQSELERLKMLEKVGGAVFVSGLVNVVPSGMNAPSYATIVLDYARRRDMLRTVSQSAQRIYNLKESTDDTITWAVQRLQSHGRGGDLVAAKDVVNELHDEFQEYIDEPLETDQVRGVDTGWQDINAALGGWKPGLYVILGEPHVGKSWKVLTAAMNVARQGKRALLFSLEMKAIQLVRRLCLQHAGITQRDYDLGRVADEQVQKFAEMEAEIYDWNLDIADSMSSASAIFSTIHREMRSDNPPEFIAIDYLGLVETSYGRESTNWEMIALTRALKNMARQLQVPIAVPHQISDKMIQGRGDKRPKMSDGYGSGGISQDADVVLGLYNPFKYGEGLQYVMWVFVLKDRTGGASNPNAPIELTFTSTGRLVDYSSKKENGYDWVK